MEDMIEALQILLKYPGSGVHDPFHCEHDVLTITAVDPDQVSGADKDRLAELGILVGDPWSDGDNYFYSYRYGSS